MASTGHKYSQLNIKFNYLKILTIMKKSGFVVSILIGFLLIPLVFRGQTVVLNLPEKYVIPTENPEPPKEDDTRLRDRPWFVWSDRGENPVYLTSDRGEKIAQLNYGDALAVIRVKSNKLLVAKRDDVINGMIAPGINPIGWVDADKLLLWDNCLKTEQCKLDKKAMVLNVFDSDNANTPGQNPKFYNGAGTNFEAIGDAGTGITQIYFVYKETADFLLVGKSSSFEESAFNNVVAGWIPKRYCTIWNTNLALEINWYPDAVSERERMGNNVLVWESNDNAVSLNKNGKIQFSESPKYKRRANGFANHFLILDQDYDNSRNTNNHTFKVAIINGIEQSYQEGYTIRHPSNANYPWFQYVLLVEQNELYRLMNSLHGFIAFENYPSPIKRERLIEVFEQIFTIFYGNITNVPLKDLLRCGCDIYDTNIFYNISLSDLYDPLRVSDSEIRKLVMDFEKTSKAIDEIYQQGRNYPHIEFPGNSHEIYYWVPVDIFPHN